MFSISTAIRRKSLPNNELELLDDSDKNKYELYNENYYDIYGNVVKEASESDYKREFILLLERNDLEIEEILNHHYFKSNSQQKFLNYLKNLSQFDNLNNGVKHSIIEWLNKEILPSNNDTLEEESKVIKLEKPNNVIESTIDEYLAEFNQKTMIDDENYFVLKEALKFYFENDIFKNDIGKIKVKNINVKTFAHALKALFKMLKSKKKLDFNYLKFAKDHISLFEDTDFDERNYTKSSLYKYFTNKKI